MLQALSPGELQSAENARNFAKRLVGDWLTRYKFKNWRTHSRSGKEVTESEKRERGDEIAEELCNHKRWLTHGRSIKIEDLDGMRLKITDYSRESALAEAIRRYHTLLQMTFDSTSIYKVFETPTSQILKMVALPVPPQMGPVPPQMVPPPHPVPDTIMLQLLCQRCRTPFNFQANFKKTPLQPGHHRFPADNRFKCSGCGAEIDLTGLRRQIEIQSKRTVIEEY